jgi:hypothetical protein
MNKVKCKGCPYLKTFFKWRKRAASLIEEGLFEGASGRFSAENFIHDIRDFGKEKKGG